jgi:hypothetical protein
MHELIFPAELCLIGPYAKALKNERCDRAPGGPGAILTRFIPGQQRDLLSKAATLQSAPDVLVRLDAGRGP